MVLKLSRSALVLARACAASRNCSTPYSKPEPSATKAISKGVASSLTPSFFDAPVGRLSRPVGRVYL